MNRDRGLEKIVQPIVEGLGYRFVGLQNFQQGRRLLIRLYIDKEDGVNIDDCERVSRQVNATLSVESSIRGDYLLEVSSPGLDRLLFTPDQFREFLGKEAAIRLIVPMNGKRNLKGWIHSVEGDVISIKMEGKILALSFADIAEARLVPEW